MKIEDFQKFKDLVDKELKVDENNITSKSIQLSNVYTQFLKIYSKELKDLKAKQVERDKIYGELYHHYKFEYDHALETKAEIDTYVRKDPKFYQIALEYSQIEVQVKFLEDTLAHINNIGFRIKNYIDLQKLSKGFGF